MTRSPSRLPVSIPILKNFPKVCHKLPLCVVVYRGIFLLGLAMGKEKRRLYNRLFLYVLNTTSTTWFPSTTRWSIIDRHSWRFSSCSIAAYISSKSDARNSRRGAISRGLTTLSLTLGSCDTVIVCYVKAHRAPVEAGQRLGTLTLQANGQPLAAIALVAPEAIAKLSWLQITKQLLSRLCFSAPA